MAEIEKNVVVNREGALALKTGFEHSKLPHCDASVCVNPFRLLDWGRQLARKLKKSGMESVALGSR